MTQLEIEKNQEFCGHELVSFFSDEKSGLWGFIAIHNTNLGPATGGTRMFPYSSEKEALSDVLRLSRAMTYKCALAGLKYGGGKAIIVGNPKRKTKALLEAYGRKIYFFGGMFTTGTDAGIDDTDAQIMGKTSKFILGRPNGVKKESTSDMAALGVFYGIIVVAHRLFGSESLQGKTIAIQGLGKLGGELARLALDAGATVIGADIDKDVVGRMRKKYPRICLVNHTDIHKQECDVYAPCALWGELTPKSILEIRARAIVGGSNNQLSSNEVGNALHQMGILYAPDYVVNAGGLINIVDELETGGYKRSRVQQRIKNIQSTLKTIFDTSKRKNVSTHMIADDMAEQIFNGKKRS